MVLFRRLLGDVLRRHRQRQQRTLRDVAAAAKVSLGYLSEIERGRKEASSELLASLCAALGISLADVLREVSDDIAMLEHPSFGSVGFTASQPRLRPAAPIGSVSAVSAGPAAPALAPVPVVGLSAETPRWRVPVAAA